MSKCSVPYGSQQLSNELMTIRNQTAIGRPSIQT